jgi:hypothetical protein
MIKRYRVKAFASIMVDCGVIEASSIAAAQSQAAKIVSERYPRNTLPYGAAPLQIEAAVAVEIPRGKKC